MKIAVVDYNPIHREGVKKTLEKHDLDVVFAGQHLDDLPKSTELLLCFVDQYGNQRWQNCIQQAVASGLKVIVYDIASNLQRPALFKKLGAHGYLSSTFNLDDFPQVLRVVKKNNFFIDPSLPFLFFERLAPYENYLDAFNPNVALTDQENEVLDLLIEGYTTKEISKRLTSNKRLIDETKEKIFAKIGAVDNLSLILYRICSRL
ncbi:MULTISPECIES: LuxR C-terminal-related transcriptional regulator [Olivibacter]|jgi:DNA-binding NarL/FixJ family response regulator|uniref:LuxR C-terminal-related transcriptional regulator n=2 Tax=Olivibacter TaxID=376469 RepID=A0ABV6HJJ3_9SPHI|nr:MULTISPECIES: LuxR C-terminal-related transcriptional regulator [Olivibacter]MCL4640065.1 LuxR C-terminal-related transcriptional regulator [Olivibacter sp. UJ_SKK_5.1]MDM8176468.1 LuxR C-terminal-related transcriptional regulator [Olivibacter sp. 47]MDX3916078.1 LuxR C-terminal-related transcriptional regulator [Pseudosphingobacterium sp.]QEL00731.1 response regulator transcription factor [Olivibacter sp. LS-1]